MAIAQPSAVSSPPAAVELEHLIGFSGTFDSVLFHPAQKDTIIYAVGSVIVVSDLNDPYALVVFGWLLSFFPVFCLLSSCHSCPIILCLLFDCPLSLWSFSFVLLLVFLPCLPYCAFFLHFPKLFVLLLGWPHSLLILFSFSCLSCSVTIKIC